MDVRNGTNEYRMLEPPSHFANFFASQSIFSFHVQTVANVVHATVKTEHLTVRTTDAHFFGWLKMS